ncbi:hypothetical protein CEXT_356081 [Caerostris extrusa]|uniref:Uncharacterized protein n=1 Tax=Caerostris extrusa TaxID=172846 RepID=A0AAV4XJG4_CAEEX|nr:hypothetical protein CEXT_356081 [Caerostris extrusa]
MACGTSPHANHIPILQLRDKNTILSRLDSELHKQLLTVQPQKNSPMPKIMSDVMSNHVKTTCQPKIHTKQGHVGDAFVSEQSLVCF